MGRVLHFDQDNPIVEAETLMILSRLTKKPQGKDLICLYYFYSSVVGNAVVCPAVLAEHTVFLLGTQTQFRLLLAKFNAPPEASEAMITVKKCTDNISYLKRVLVEEALVISLSFLW